MYIGRGAARRGSPERLYRITCKTESGSNGLFYRKMVYSFPRATTIKDHKLHGLKQQKYFPFTTQEVRNPKSRYLKGWLLVEALGEY